MNKGDLVEATRAAGIPYEASDSGEWVRFRCPHGGIRYVVRSRLADGYLAWCDDDAPRPEWYLTPQKALERSLAPSQEASARERGQPSAGIGPPSTSQQATKAAAQ